MNILLTGGARSGKSSFAEELARKRDRPVLFVATAEIKDEEMRRRIEIHKRSRPSSWKTLEVTHHIGGGIKENIGGAQVIIVDCITLLVNNILCRYTDRDGKQVEAGLIEEEVRLEINGLIDCMKDTGADFIVVTNEVGTGLVPVNPMGRLYRDLLGRANQMLAEHTDQVYLLVAGLPVRLKPAAY